jgi:transmembrane sensor
MQAKIDFAALRARTMPLPEGRARTLEAAVLARHERHTARVRFARVAGPLAVAAAFLAVVAHRPAPAIVAASTVPTPAKVPAAAAPDFGGLVMADGSRVTFLVAGTQLTQSGTEGRTSTLVAGAARFDVVHDARVPFRVTAGPVVVEDVGTVFTIASEADGATRVAVESGAVSVRGSGRERTLEAGESDVFRALAPGGDNPTPSRPATPRPASWKRLAQAGEYDRAYALIQAPGSSVRDDPEELLLAADAARLTGHVDRAVPLLRKLMTQFPSDSRVGLAAFTLGRVLLDDLDQPREAAGAFASAYGRGGPLAEDALSRQVEALHRAGDDAGARAAAARYLAAFPSGRRASLVRRLTDTP